MPSAKDARVRICHFSDLHLPLTQSVPPQRLVGKRLLGYGNIRFLRGKTHKPEAFVHLLEHLVGEQGDFVVMTGDVSNLALPFEFAEADRLFRDAGLRPENTLVIPGNHDRYTMGADLGEAFEKQMAPWLPHAFSRADGYPIVQKVGPIALMALDTAVWRMGIRDAGLVNSRQMERMADILNGDRMHGYWPVIAMHHPPFRRHGTFYKDFMSGLVGGDKLPRMMNGRSATVLHGHMHEFSRRRVEGLDVIGVPSASNDTGDQLRQLAYHVYTFTCRGLEKAESVRYWPDDGGGKGRFERLPIPDNVQGG
ncbi:MAG: metallophosphoesterase [Proteobacteria bacterium]|nr:metallophosphoesterase [Pseudomonadota bacterium]